MGMVSMAQTGNLNHVLFELEYAYFLPNLPLLESLCVLETVILNLKERCVIFHPQSMCFFGFHSLSTVYHFRWEARKKKTIHLMFKLVTKRLLLFLKRRKILFDLQFLQLFGF